MTPAQPPRTAAAIKARRHNTVNKLDQVRAALTRLRRENSALTYPAVARRAAVSRTFLYENPEARAPVGQALTRDTTSSAQARAEHDAQQETSWRERALNAEDALKTAHLEIRTQRTRIGALMGSVRDLEQDHGHDSAERTTAENTTLKHRVQQITGENRVLEERLQATRCNLRFQDRRLADLEARLLEQPS